MVTFDELVTTYHGLQVDLSDATDRLEKSGSEVDVAKGRLALVRQTHSSLERAVSGLSRKILAVEGQLPDVLLDEIGRLRGILTTARRDCANGNYDRAIAAIEHMRGSNPHQLGMGLPRTTVPEATSAIGLGLSSPDPLGVYIDSSAHAGLAPSSKEPGSVGTPSATIDRVMHEGRPLAFGEFDPYPNVPESTKEALPSASHALFVARSPIPSVLLQLQRTLRDRYVVTGTIVRYAPTDPRVQVFERSEYSRGTSLLTCAGTRLPEVLQNPDGLHFIQSLFHTDADRDELHALFNKMTDGNADCVRVWTPSQESRARFPYRQVLLYTINGLHIDARNGINAGRYIANPQHRVA